MSSPIVADQSTQRDPLCRAVLVLLALRLVAWCFLLPPWGGPDEPAHHGLVETCRASFRWPRFGSVMIPDRVMEPADRASHALAATNPNNDDPGGMLSAGHRAPMMNYETQQSPLYYLSTGSLLRVVPGLSPLDELYVLRILNAAAIVLVGIVTIRASRSLGLGGSAWLPTGLLALIPGVAVAFSRVTNDALCALLLAIGLAAMLSPADRARTILGGALGTGLAAWAKLYGVVLAPIYVLHVLARRRRVRWPAVGVVVACVGGLGALSWRINGTLIPLQENLALAKPVSLVAVPWVRDAWTILKTQIWVSGGSTIVFPTWVYVPPALLLLIALVRALVTGIRERSTLRGQGLLVLAFAMTSFGAALVYHASRNFAANGVPGGTGGWYLWALGLAEAILIGAGMLSFRHAWRIVCCSLTLFLMLSVLGDLVAFGEGAGVLVTTPGNHHVLGIRHEEFGEMVASFLGTRPIIVGVLGPVMAIVSWFFAVALVVKLWRGDAPLTEVNGTPAEVAS